MMDTHLFQLNFIKWLGLIFFIKKQDILNYFRFTMCFLYFFLVFQYLFSLFSHLFPLLLTFIPFKKLRKQRFHFILRAFQLSSPPFLNFSPNCILIAIIFRQFQVHTIWARKQINLIYLLFN